MDNYKILKRLGMGSQGAVYLVEDKRTSQKCVMKQIECNDEREAAKAHKEAVVLKDLQHCYICKYKDFFLCWDKTSESMMMCIVMEHYKHGDLDKALKQRRSKKEPIEEKVVRRWVGQLIEALVFIHNNRVIHRDLKPSNVFITEDFDLLIGDFGVSTIMEDVRVITRSTVGSVNWIAPEVLEAQAPKYDERSDVWSLGCVTLEMITCGLLDQVALSGILFQIKLSPNVLEDLLCKVQKTYSVELCDVVRSMLRRSFHQRPTASALVKVPVIQDCLRLNNSSLYEEEEQECGSVNDAPACPKNGSVAEVFDYLQENIQNKYCVIQGLSYLVELSPQNGLCDGDRDQLRTIMLRYSGSSDVQALALRLLSNQEPQLDGPLLLAIVKAMEAHTHCCEIQKGGTTLLVMAASEVSESHSKIFSELHGVQAVLGALRAFPDCADLVLNSFMFLWSLSVHEDIKRLVGEEDGIRLIYKLLCHHYLERNIMDTGLSLLWSLTVEDVNVVTMVDVGVVDVAISALRDHMKDPGVVKYSCALLSSLVGCSETTAFQVVHTQKGLEGIPLVVESLRQHRQDTDVLEHVLSLVKQMSYYRDVLEEMVSLKVCEMIADLQDQYKDQKFEQKLKDLVETMSV